MKKISIFLFIFTSTALSTSLAACSVQQPQVIVTSEVTVTSLPPTATLIPTPTLHPQFIEIQEQIAATGERFTLKADGSVEDKTADGVTSVPGLKLDKNGTWQLSVGEEQVEIKPADVSFDDDKGINVAGYTLDRETGKWGVKIEQLDISNPETFKFRSWEELTSPEYLAELEQKEQAGLLPSIPENPSYVKQGYVNLLFDKEPSNFLKKYGIESIFSLSNGIAYLDKSKRPFITVEAYKTEFKGIKMVFLVDKWQNSDKSHAFMAQLMFDYNFTKAYLNDYASTTRYPTGSYFIKESERGDGCKALINQLSESNVDSSEFCEYYYSNSEIFLPKNIYRDWQDTGVLDTKGILPVSIASSYPISK